MNKILIILVGLSISAITSAKSFAGGFDCPELNKKIEITQNSRGESVLVNDHLVLPMGSDVDSYQDRWGIYNILMQDAQLNFPYMPDVLTVYHLGRSRKMYLEGFHHLDDLQDASFTRLPKMYCKALLTAIDKTMF